MAAAALTAALVVAANGAPLNERPLPAHSWLVPALEIELVHLSFLAFSNLVTGEPFARVSADSIGALFDGRRRWTFDVDYFLTNQFGHPYQGALSFTAARSAGLPFWFSALYALVGSFTWELFFEVDPPSINDQITTTIGGVLLGEVLHRSALMLLRDDTLPRWGRWLGAFVLEPIGAFNRWLFAWGLDERDHVTPVTFALVSAGIGIATRRTDIARLEPDATDGADFVMQALFTYGIFDPRDPPDRTPFSHFDLSVLVTPGSLPLGALFIRGLLLGRSFGALSPRLRGVWGLFGEYDYLQPKLARASAVGFGPGTALQWRFSQNGFLQLTAMASLLPFGTIGSLGLDEDVFRDYHIGPGGSAIVEARLIHREVAMLRAVARQWLVVGAYTPPSGFESMTALTLGLIFKLGWHIGASAEVDAVFRVPMFHDDTYDRWVHDTVVRVSLCYLSDEGFGVLAPLEH